jgi:hypothetical protein
MLTFTKTKNTRLPDSVHNAGVTLQSRDIPHTLPSPIFYERAPVVRRHSCDEQAVVMNYFFCQKHLKQCRMTVFTSNGCLNLR